MKILLHVLVWIPTALLLGFAAAIFFAWVLLGVHISQDLSDRALAAFMVGLCFSFGSGFVSLELIED